MQQEAYGHEALGTAPPQAPLQPALQAIVFFHSNRKVCDDYFTRIRLHLLAASDRCAGDVLMCGAVVFHGFMRLQDMWNFVKGPEAQRDDGSIKCMQATGAGGAGLHVTTRHHWGGGFPRPRWWLTEKTDGNCQRLAGD